MPHTYVVFYKCELCVKKKKKKIVKHNRVCYHNPACISNPFDYRNGAFSIFPAGIKEYELIIRRNFMASKFMQRFSALLLAGVLIAGGTVSAYAANVGGGTWDYGTYISGLNRKTVYSNYYHPGRVHKSSVSIGTTAVSSGWVNAGKTSYASASGKWKSETHAYYNYQ